MRTALGGRRLATAVALVSACAAAACTSGTTPDCSDAQCLPVIEVEGGGEAGGPADASAGDTGHAAADGSLSDASNERDAPDGG
jgi:hypothetical protein